MRGFDEAWLNSYNAKRGALIERPLVIGFTLPYLIKLLNETLRMHWSVRRKYQQKLSTDVAVLTRHIPPGKPYERASLSIVRYSIQTPDDDGLVGGAKNLIDTLLVHSSRHPHGLGFITDDDPAHLTSDIRSALCSKRADQRTVVLLERIDPL